MTDIPLRWVGTDATGAAAASVKKNIDSVGKAATGAQGGVKGLTSAMSSMAPAGKTAQGALSGMDPQQRACSAAWAASLRQWAWVLSLALAG